MLPELTNRILEEWSNLFPEISRPGSINYLGIPGSIEGGTTVFLAFTNEDKKPAFAVKIHRYHDAQDRALNERDVLNYIQSHGGIVATSIPKLILCEKIANVWTIVLSPIEGRPMFALMANDGMPDLRSAASNMRITANWLAQLHNIKQDSIIGISNLLKKDGIRNIEEFLRLFDLSKSEEKYVNELLDSIDIVISDRSFIKHGDFCRHNILISKDSGEVKVRVVDWTDSKLIGFPLHDLFFFLTTYYLQIRKESGIKGFIKAFEDTFLNRTLYNKLIKECILDYCKMLYINVLDVEKLFAIFLIERAIFEAHQVMKCLRRGSFPRFTIYMAEQEGLDNTQVEKAQFWIHLFKTFFGRRDDFSV